MRAETGTTRADRRGALWPVSFEAHPRARAHAYALTVLVVVCVVAVAADRYYWSDSQWTRTPSLFFLFFMVPSILLMGATLAGALVTRVPRVVHNAVAALAWLTTVLVVPLELLLLWLSSADLCETRPPAVDVYQIPWLSVPVLIAVSLGAGSLAGWTLAGRRLHPAARYAIWLGTAAVVLYGLLAWALGGSPTCSPLSGE